MTTILRTRALHLRRHPPRRQSGRGLGAAPGDYHLRPGSDSAAGRCAPTPLDELHARPLRRGARSLCPRFAQVRHRRGSVLQIVRCASYSRLGGDARFHWHGALCSGGPSLHRLSPAHFSMPYFLLRASSCLAGSAVCPSNSAWCSARSAAMSSVRAGSGAAMMALDLLLVAIRCREGAALLDALAGRDWFAVGGSHREASRAEFAEADVDWPRPAPLMSPLKRRLRREEMRAT